MTTSKMERSSEDQRQRHFVSGFRMSTSKIGRRSEDSQCTFLNKLFTRIISGDFPQLKNILLCGCYLTSVQPTLLEAVVRLEHFNLSSCNLTTEQLAVLLRAIQESEDIKLKTLNIWNNQNISSVEPDLLKAVVRLENCNLSSCKLTTEQLTVLYRAIQESTDLKLKTLNIGSNSNISSVEPGLLQALVRLEICNLRSDLTTEQLTVLFTAIQESTDLKMKTLLIIKNSNISSVEPGLLQAVVRLEDCSLPHCRLTTEQLTSLFRAIQESEDFKLKILDLSGSNTTHGDNPDLSLMEPRLLQAVVRLVECDLNYCNLTTEQLTIIFRAIQESTDLKLKTLNVGSNSNISSVEPGLLQAVVRLEKCNLSSCELTKEQFTVLFRAIQESEDLKLRVLFIHLIYKNLSGVAPDILVEAVARLERVDLAHTSLTTDQLTGIYRLVAERRPIKLRWIDIGGNDIWKVTASLRKNANENPDIIILSKSHTMS